MPEKRHISTKLIYRESVNHFVKCKSVITQSEVKYRIVRRCNIDREDLTTVTQKKTTHIEFRKIHVEE